MTEKCPFWYKYGHIEILAINLKSSSEKTANIPNLHKNTVLQSRYKNRFVTEENVY